MKFDITPILEAIVAIFCAVLTAYVIPCVKERLSAERYENLRSAVKVAVEAAEQLFGSKSGQRKKEYVVNTLLSKGIVCNVDEVTALIESEVYRLTDKTEA